MHLEQLLPPQKIMMHPHDLEARQNHRRDWWTSLGCCRQSGPLPALGAVPGTCRPDRRFRGDLKGLGRTYKFAKVVRPFASKAKGRIDSDEQKAGINQPFEAIGFGFPFHLQTTLLVLPARGAIIAR